jgi:hypothetical protein
MGSSMAAPPPKATLDNLTQEVQELGSLMAMEQHDFLIESVRTYQVCAQDEKKPACRTLVLFDIGNFMGNNATQYLAMFEPVEPNIDYKDLPDVVKINSKYRAWIFDSVIAIDPTEQAYATFDGAKCDANVIVLQGFSHGPKDPQAQYSKKVVIRVTIVDGSFSKVEIAK